MSRNLASALLTIALAAVILPPGYPAYIGAYVALGAAVCALLIFSWRDPKTLARPSALAVLAGPVLIALAVPFVYRGEQDLLAPILIMPVLSALALATLAGPARWVPRPDMFAALCLVGSAIALAGGAYEHFVLGIYRVGLGNNPIHYSSLAVLSGCLALVGVTQSQSRWRYLFLLGPAFGVACAILADSRGPFVGALGMTLVGTIFLSTWFWRERVFQIVLLIGLASGAAGLGYLLNSNQLRVAAIMEGVINLFSLSGPDDARAALYASAIEILKTSPIFGVGLGQIMDTSRSMFPEMTALATLENLHADWANFVAMAGSLGLLAWLLLLIAPLLLLVEPLARQDRATVLGVVLLFTGQLLLGATNATFGVLPQTMLYAMSLAYFMVRSRRLALDLEPT